MVVKRAGVTGGKVHRHSTGWVVGTVSFREHQLAGVSRRESQKRWFLRRIGEFPENGASVGLNCFRTRLRNSVSELDPPGRVLTR